MEVEKQPGEPQEASFIAAPMTEAEVLQSDPGICTRPEEALMEKLAEEEPLLCCQRWLMHRYEGTERYFKKALENLKADGMQGAYLQYHSLL